MAKDIDYLLYGFRYAIIKLKILYNYATHPVMYED